jgi:hypothetical protein
VREEGLPGSETFERTLEMEFLSLLDRLRVDPKVPSILPRVAAVWARKESDGQRDISRLEEQRNLKRKLLRAKLDGDIVQADHEQANAEFDGEIASIEEQFRAAYSDGMTMEAFLRFAENQNASERVLATLTP